MPARTAFVAVLCLASLGCTDSSDSEDIATTQTLVGVAPSDFLGPLTCDDAGPLKRYSATLTDVTEDLPGGPFDLPSSDVVSCRHELAFAFVVPEHRYLVEVRGYDRDDLRPERAGSPHAVDEQGRFVEPRYTTSCGFAPEEDGADPVGVLSIEALTTYANYCLPWTEHGE